MILISQGNNLFVVRYGETECLSAGIWYFFTHRMVRESIEKNPEKLISRLPVYDGLASFFREYFGEAFPSELRAEADAVEHPMKRDNILCYPVPGNQQQIVFPWPPPPGSELPPLFPKSLLPLWKKLGSECVFVV